MAQGAKAVVRLDTKQAEAKLRDLGKEGQASAGRISKSLEGGGLGLAAGAGALAGAGFGLGRRAASAVASAGGLGSVISEATAGLRAGADQFFGGPDARAAGFAREATKDAFAEQVGRSGGVITPNMRNYFNQQKERREITEQGRSAIDQELGAEVLKTMTDQFLDAIKAGFDKITGAVNKPGAGAGMGSGR